MDIRSRLLRTETMTRAMISSSIVSEKGLVCTEAEKAVIKKEMGKAREVQKSGHQRPKTSEGK